MKYILAFSLLFNGLCYGHTVTTQLNQSFEVISKYFTTISRLSNEIAITQQTDSVIDFNFSSKRLRGDKFYFRATKSSKDIVEFTFLPQSQIGLSSSVNSDNAMIPATQIVPIADSIDRCHDDADSSSVQLEGVQCFNFRVYETKGDNERSLVILFDPFGELVTIQMQYAKLLHNGIFAEWIRRSLDDDFNYHQYNISDGSMDFSGRGF